MVEDDAAVAASSADGLAALGFSVEHVAQGAAALAAVASADPPDVVLLDLGLPDMDGQEVCRRIRAMSEVPIIIVSARGDEADRVIALELGADGREGEGSLRHVLHREAEGGQPVGRRRGDRGVVLDHQDAHDPIVAAHGRRRARGHARAAGRAAIFDVSGTSG